MPLTIFDGSVPHASEAWSLGAGLEIHYDSDGVPVLSGSFDPGTPTAGWIEVGDSNTAPALASRMMFQGDVISVNEVTGVATLDLDGRYRRTGQVVPWAEVGTQGRPTSLSGWGITDAYTRTQLQTPGQANINAGNVTSGDLSWARIAGGVLRGDVMFAGGHTMGRERVGDHADLEVRHSTNQGAGPADYAELKIVEGGTLLHGTMAGSVAMQVWRMMPSSTHGLVELVQDVTGQMPFLSVRGLDQQVRMAIAHTGDIRVFRGDPIDWGYSSRLTGDTIPRFISFAGGMFGWGPGGSSNLDTNLYRSAANLLRTDDTFEALALRINGQVAINSNREFLGWTHHDGIIGPAGDLIVLNGPTGAGRIEHPRMGSRMVLSATGGVGNPGYEWVTPDSLSYSLTGGSGIHVGGVGGSHVISVRLYDQVIGQEPGLIFRSTAEGLALSVDFGLGPRQVAEGNHTHGISETTGTLPAGRGGTGIGGGVTAGRLLVGAGLNPMTLLAPGATGGFVRSNGSAWVRSTLQAGDIPAHQHGIGQITGGLTPDLIAAGGTGGLSTPVGLQHPRAGARRILSATGNAGTAAYEWITPESAQYGLNGGQGIQIGTGSGSHTIGVRLHDGGLGDQSGLRFTGTTPTIALGVDFGTGVDQVARGNHDHSGQYAAAGHTHAFSAITGSVGVGQLPATVARTDQQNDFTGIQVFDNGHPIVIRGHSSAWARGVDLRTPGGVRLGQFGAHGYAGEGGLVRMYMALHDGATLPHDSGKGVYLLAGGNVGIGRNTASYPLDVNGAANAGELRIGGVVTVNALREFLGWIGHDQVRGPAGNLLLLNGPTGATSLDHPRIGARRILSATGNIGTEAYEWVTPDSVQYNVAAGQGIQIGTGGSTFTVGVRLHDGGIGDQSGLRFTGSAPSIALAVDFGTGADQVARGNHEHDYSFVPPTRTIGTAAGSGLSGGGDLTANRNLSINRTLVDTWYRAANWMPATGNGLTVVGGTMSVLLQAPPFGSHGLRFVNGGLAVDFGTTESTVARGAHTHIWDDVTNRPPTFPPSPHTHSAADVTSGAFDARLGWQKPFVRDNGSPAWQIGFNVAAGNSNQSGQPGAIVIKTNLIRGESSTMFTIEVAGRLHSGGTLIRSVVTAYAQTSGAITQHGVVHHSQDFRPQTRLAWAPDNRLCLILGDTSDTWSYPRLYVPHAGLGYSGSDPWMWDDWEVLFETNLGGYSNSVTLVDKSHARYFDGQLSSYYRNVNNVNAGILAASHGGTGRSSTPLGQILMGGGVTELALVPFPDQAGLLMRSAGTIANRTYEWVLPSTLQYSITGGQGIQALGSGGSYTVGVKLSDFDGTFNNPSGLKFHANGGLQVDVGSGPYQVAAGNHTHGPGEVGAAPANHNHDSRYGLANQNLRTTDSPTFAGLHVGIDLLTGGFGARTTDGVTDWNDISNARSGQGYTLLGTGADNAPPATGYYHPFSFEYSGKGGGNNLTQFAIPYRSLGTTGHKVHYRSRYSGAWDPWVTLASEQWADATFAKPGHQHDANDITGVPPKAIVTGGGTGGLGYELHPAAGATRLLAATGGAGNPGYSWVTPDSVQYNISGGTGINVGTGGGNYVVSLHLASGIGNEPGLLADSGGLRVDFGEGSTQAARGNHTHSQYAAVARQIIAGTGLTGGGTLAADRTLNVQFGTTGSTVAAGNHNHALSSLTGSLPGDRLSGTVPLARMHGNVARRDLSGTWTDAQQTFERTSGGNGALQVRTVGDSTVRWAIRGDGRQVWSAGSGSTDTNLYRQSAGVLRTGGDFQTDGSVVVNMGGAAGAVGRFGQYSSNTAFIGLFRGGDAVPFIMSNGQETYVGAPQVSGGAIIFRRGGNELARINGTSALFSVRPEYSDGTNTWPLAVTMWGSGSPPSPTGIPPGTIYARI